MIKLRENKFIKIIFGTIRTLIYVLLIAVLIVMITQRVSKNAIAIGGIRIFNVVSGSMEPVFERGDILMVKETDPNIITVGQDIVYKGREGQVDGKIITHRVVNIENKKDGKVFHTQGINNMSEDPEVKPDQILGVVKYRFVILSYINKLMYNMYFFYAAVIIPLGLIVFLEFKNIRRNLKDKDDEED